MGCSLDIPIQLYHSHNVQTPTLKVFLLFLIHGTYYYCWWAFLHASSLTSLITLLDTKILDEPARIQPDAVKTYARGARGEIMVV